MEVPAEALLVSVPRDPHHHPVAVLTLREELQRRCLAAQLILGVVEVGEVLDLRHRHEAAHGGAEREAEDRRLVEQRVEHPAGAEAGVEAAGDAVDAALRRDVLAEQEHLGMSVERGGEGAVDREGQRQRLGGRLLRGRVGPGQLGHLGRRARRERPHHLRGALELGPTGRSERDLADALPGLEVVGGELGTGAETHRDEPPSGCEQRIALEVGAHGGRRAVGGLDVGARVAEVANGAQVKHRRPPGLAHPIGQSTRSGERGCGVVTVAPSRSEGRRGSRAHSRPTRRARAR